MAGNDRKALQLNDPVGPSVWLEQRPPPADAWEYQMRKAANDAVYQNLQYVPYSSKMPVDPNEQHPRFIWVRLNASHLRVCWI